MEVMLHEEVWFENEESLIGSCGQKAWYHLAVLLGKVVELRVWNLIAWVIAGGSVFQLLSASHLWTWCHQLVTAYSSHSAFSPLKDCSTKACKPNYPFSLKLLLVRCVVTPR